MTNPFLGEIRAFSFNFAPTGWAMCNGQLLSIQQNQALFSLLGTTYGGNGTTTFALPDVRGRIAMSQGPSTVIGEMQGTESVNLSILQLPIHNHQVTANPNGASNFTAVPGTNVILGTGSEGASASPTVTVYSSAATNVALAPLSNTGGSQPHENRMPSLVMNYCIALSGIYPSRN
jgi:microcystin-dependent protein